MTLPDKKLMEPTIIPKSIDFHPYLEETLERVVLYTAAVVPDLQQALFHKIQKAARYPLVIMNPVCQMEARDQSARSPV